MEYGIDIVGRIAILKFPEKTKLKDKKEAAKQVMDEHKIVETVLEKTNKVSGRLRTIKTKVLAGKKNKETVYRESGCLFKFDVDKCYFSPRLANERLEVSREVKGNVLVLFAGVAPFSIVIAKNPNVKKVVSIELGRECYKYAKENARLNKVMDKIEVIQGDVKKVLPKMKEKFDIIVMPRPQLKDTFLKETFPLGKKGTKIFYYDFGKDAEEILEKVKNEAVKAGRKISIEKIKKAGEIGPYAHRWRVDFVVLN